MQVPYSVGSVKHWLKEVMLAYHGSGSELLMMFKYQHVNGILSTKVLLLWACRG